VEIASIVEGFGEVEAVPTLIRRFAQLNGRHDVVAPRSFRVARDKLLRDGELERVVQQAANEAGPDGRILILIDADDTCPATMGPLLQARALRARPDRVSRVVLAKFEFESWFLAAAVSLRGLRHLPRDLVAPFDPESIRGAKEWLSIRMQRIGGYQETLDQPALAAQFNLEQARAAPSFDKCYRELTRLLAG
jgi:uncharacterized protein DUF4276